MDSLSSSYAPSPSPAALGAVAAQSRLDISALVTQKMSRSHMNSGASNTSNGHGVPAAAHSRPSGHIHGSSNTALVILGSICASITAAAPPKEWPMTDTRERSTLRNNGDSGSELASTTRSNACARSNARQRACSCRKRHQFLGSSSRGMS